MYIPNRTIDFFKVDGGKGISIKIIARSRPKKKSGKCIISRINIFVLMDLNAMKLAIMQKGDLSASTMWAIGRVSPI